MLKQILASLTIIFVSFSLSASELRWQGELDNKFFADAVLSNTNLSLDDYLYVDFTFKIPSDYALDEDTLRSNLLKYIGLSEPPFALLDEQRSITPEGNLKLQFKLEPLIPGKQYLSFYNIRFLPKEQENAQAVEIISDIFTVHITAPKEKEAFKPIPAPLLSLTDEYPIAIDASNRQNLLDSPQRNIKEAKYNQEIWRQKSFPWEGFLGIIAFAVLALIIKFKPKEAQQKKEENQAQRILFSREKGIQALGMLKQKTFQAPLEREDFYLQITRIVRSYIEETFQIHAETETTQEFLNEMMQSAKLTQDQKNLLSDFVVEADRVKYANHSPSPEECTKAYKAAEKLIIYH